MFFQGLCSPHGEEWAGGSTSRLRAEPRLGKQPVAQLGQVSSAIPGTSQLPARGLLAPTAQALEESRLLCGRWSHILDSSGCFRRSGIRISFLAVACPR